MPVDANIVIAPALDPHLHSADAMDLLNRLHHERNIRDFANSSVPAITPRQALE